LSFTNANLLAPGYRYGFGAYAAVLGQPEFAATLRITGIFVTASVAAQLGLGFAIALLIHAGTRAGVAGTVATRTVVLTAWAIPGVLIGVVWRILLSEGSYGIVNYALSRAGLGPIRFLSDPSLALLSIIVANVWRGTAFSMILQYAGLQTIPPELYEAAAVDGAGPARQLTHVTLPVMRPILFINLVLITVATLNTFDMVLALTGGGPGRSTEVVALAVYTTIFREFSLGRGAALAVILLLINLAFVAAYARLAPAAVEGDG